jgi:hypothetical protein
LSGDQLALVDPIPAFPPASPSLASEGIMSAHPVPQVQITTTPPGIPFKVFASASPAEGVLWSGTTPANMNSLPPGSYRIVFAPPGAAKRTASLQVPNAGTAFFRQELPHGVLKVRIQPEGAEVICDGQEVGNAPLDLPVLPGRHEVSARWNDRDARVRVVQVVDSAEQTIFFDFRGGSESAKSRSRRLKKSEDDSVLTKMGRSLKTIFGGDKNKR